MPGEEAETAFQRLRRRWKTEYQLFRIRNEMCECGTPDERMEEAEKASSSHELKKIRPMKRGQVRRAGDSRLEDHNVAVKDIVQMQRRTLELVGGLGGDAGERDLFLRKVHGRARSI